MKRGKIMSMDLMIKKIIDMNSPVVAGLDPKLDYVPDFLVKECFDKYGANAAGAAEALLRFNIALIDELCEVVPAVKVQAAYYEMYGIEGMGALYKTVSYAKSRGMYVILDGKRGDIGSTAEAYSSGWLGKTTIGTSDYAMSEADCLTVNPYLGSDGIIPFVNDCKKYDKGIFALVKTSNPSSGELQDLKVGDKAVYEMTAQLVDKWGADNIGEYGYSAVGAVVGATYPAQAKSLREKMKHTYFLVPGYGAQGAGADDVAVSFDKDGLGAIVNSSRAIMCAYKKSGSDKEFAKAAKDEAYNMTKAINAAIGR